MEEKGAVVGEIQLTRVHSQQALRLSQGQKTNKHSESMIVYGKLSVRWPRRLQIHDCQIEQLTRSQGQRTYAPVCAYRKRSVR